MSEIDGVIEPAHPRYTDPPVVHLEQVIWCIKHYPILKEAMFIKDGNSLCDECVLNS